MLDVNNNLYHFFVCFLAMQREQKSIFFWLSFLLPHHFCSANWLQNLFSRAAFIRTFCFINALQLKSQLIDHHSSFSGRKKTTLQYHYKLFEMWEPTKNKCSPSIQRQTRLKCCFKLRSRATKFNIEWCKILACIDMDRLTNFRVAVFKFTGCSLFGHYYS